MHLPGIGKASAARIKDCGLLCWDDALTAEVIPLKGALLAEFRAGVEESRERLLAGTAADALWFSDRLPVSEQWRLYPHFRGQAAYVDIETTGLSFPRGQITTIALYDGERLKTYVQGRNLDDFVRDIKEYSLLVTWNGRAFDAPFLRRSFGIELKMAHLDLFPVFRALGIKGGLKKVEKELGLDRGDLDGVDGYMAILLWNEYCRTGRESVLDTLLAYNAEDVLSLETLCLHACARHGLDLSAQPHGSDIDALPLAAATDPTREALNPFVADRALVERLIYQRCF
jgi:uncharacterized protein YprB with RNaseH-like and TPR domain